MAAVIAHVTGTALAPGVSRNGRLYTREAIGKAVARAKTRIADGKRPISMRSHHAAGDDSSRIVGMVTDMWQDPDTGAAKYAGAIADTEHGRTIAALTDDTDGKPAFLKGVSIRGAWMAPPRTEKVDGRDTDTADDIEISGLDFTAEPGVDDANVAHVPSKPAPGESADAAPYPITESAPEALVSVLTAEAVAEKGAAALKSGEPAAPPTKAPAGSYADPGYQDDKAKRYPLDTLAHARAAWGFVNQKDAAAKYTPNQLKRIKGRIVAALKKHGVKVSADTETDTRYLVNPVLELTKATTVTECMGYDEDRESNGSFYVSLTNGPVSVSVSSYVVDPADLDLIGRAAMDGACKALATIDPDMDGDIDVPGAGAEDADRDTDDGEPSANVPGTACPCGCGCAIPVNVTGCPCGCGDCEVCGSTATTGEAAPDPSAAVAESTEPDPAPAGPADSIPAPDPAADPNPETEAPDVSEPTTPAVETTPATAIPAAPAPAAPTFTFEQMMSLLTAAGRPVEAAPAPVAPVIEAAPVAPAPAATAVAETQEQMVARLVAEGVANAQRTFIQDLAESGALAGRKGLTAQAPGAQTPAAPVAEGTNSYGMPAGAPDKPLHQYSTEEFNKWAGPMVFEHAVGHYAGRRGH